MICKLSEKTLNVGAFRVPVKKPDGLYRVCVTFHIVDEVKSVNKIVTVKHKILSFPSTAFSNPAGGRR